MPQTQTSQAQTQEVQTQTQTIQVYPIPIEIIDAANWVVPGLQAVFNSPHWRPVVLKDKIVYIWPGEDAEALLVPGTPVYRLFYITRTSERVLLFLVEPQVPGNRIANLYKKPLIFDNYYVNEFIALFIAYKGDLKEIALKCNSHGNGSCVTCEGRDICLYDIVTVTITPVQDP